MHPLLASIKAFLFDFDGTLAQLNIDFKKLKGEIFRLADRMGLDQPVLPDPPYLLEVVQSFRDQINGFHLEGGERFFNESMALIEKQEWEAAGRAELFPFTLEVLERLRRNHYRIAILTRNSGRAVRRVFPDLDRYADLFLPREGVTEPKPHPGHLRQAVDRLNLPPGRAAMVGDHPIDILSGKRAGTLTVAVLSGKIGKSEMESARPDLILPNLSSLPDFL